MLRPGCARLAAPDGSDGVCVGPSAVVRAQRKGYGGSLSSRSLSVCLSLCVSPSLRVSISRSRSLPHITGGVARAPSVAAHDSSPAAVTAAVAAAPAP
jgi:hypothetical protein